MRVSAEKLMFADKVHVHFYERRDGQLMVMQTPTFEATEEGSIPADDGMFLDATLAQELMDALWDCGLRPSEGSGSAGALLATQAHLGDMQKLTERLLAIVEKVTP